MSPRSITRLALLVGLALPVSAAAEVAPDSVRVPRLAAVGRLWSAVELFHPWVPIDEQEVFDRPIGPPQGPLYLEPTVMLVDERTISQAEHSGLFHSAFNGTTFVGSQTAGANGDITTFTVPGGIRLTFSGHDVRHADGRQLQQVGLPIAVTARPTIAGLHAGRDEVLEAGVRHLEAQITAGKKRPARRAGSP